MTGARSAIWALACLAAAPAHAEGPLPGGETIRAMLIAHDIAYGAIAWERHEANGVLLHRSSEGPVARTSLGEWRMDGAARCLRWTRAMDWECYAVALEGTPPETIRFEDPFGNVSTGRLMPRGAE